MSYMLTVAYCTPNFFLMCTASSGAVHTPDSKPQLRGPASRSARSCSICSGSSLFGAPSFLMSYLPSVPSCAARTSQPRTVEYDLLRAMHIRRMDMPSLRMAYASSLAAALGSVSFFCMLRRRTLETPDRNLLSAGITMESLYFMRILPYTGIWILWLNNVVCFVSDC